MAARDYQKGALPYAFVGIPKEVLAMPEYHALPSSSKALMLDLMAQYTGKNNGRLCPAFDVMVASGWRSQHTLIRAKLALLETSFAVLTRKGHPPRTAEWLAFTWWKLDYERSMDAELNPRTFPYLNFIRMRMGDPNKGRGLNQKREVTCRNSIVSTPKLILRTAETAPMEANK